MQFQDNVRTSVSLKASTSTSTSAPLGFSSFDGVGMTLDLATFPVQQTLSLVSSLVESILAANDQLEESSDEQLSRFHSKAVPAITVQSYLERMLKFVPFTNEVLIPILIYLDRVSAASKKASGRVFVISSLNIHRLLISSLVVSAKFNSDVFFNNARYAKVGGITMDELNRLEIEFLFMTGFNLFVPLEELQTYANSLLAHATLRAGTYDKPSYTSSINTNNTPSTPSPRIRYNFEDCTTDRYNFEDRTTDQHRPSQSSRNYFDPAPSPRSSPLVFHNHHRGLSDTAIVAE